MNISTSIYRRDRGENGEYASLLLRKFRRLHFTVPREVILKRSLASSNRDAPLPFDDEYHRLEASEATDGEEMCSRRRVPRWAQGILVAEWTSNVPFNSKESLNLLYFISSLSQHPGHKETANRSADLEPDTT